jgi:hypothetical protein
VDVEQSLLSLVCTIEELFGRKSSCFGLKVRKYGRRDPSRLPHGTLCPQILALISRRRLVGIVRYRAQELRSFFIYYITCAPGDGLIPSETSCVNLLQ